MNQALDGKELVIFDLDGTLAPSKQYMKPSMAALLSKLLERAKVAVISGGGFPQFQAQFVRSLPADGRGFADLYLLPTSGTRLYAWQGDWKEIYREDLSKEEKERIMEAFKAALPAGGYAEPATMYGDAIEDRGSQITFSALGQQAPLALKEAWDPDRSKRQKIAAILCEKLPGFDVRIGGTTSIDITKKGVNKSYGIHKLEQRLGIPIAKMLFVGDALFLGGNDYPAKATGVDCVQVSGPDETERLVAGWLSEGGQS